MFRFNWTIIREHVVPIPKLPLITYQYVTLWFCCSMLPQVKRTSKRIYNSLQNFMLRSRVSIRDSGCWMHVS